MDLEQQVIAYDQIRKQIEELENKKKEIAAQILQQMAEKKREVGGYCVRRYELLSICVSLKTAKTLDAVVLKETVDKDKIKALYEEGHAIEGVTELRYIQVSSLKKDLVE